MEEYIRIASFLAAGICMGAGAIGSAIGIGYTAAKAESALTRQPAANSFIVRTMLIGMAVASSPAIFALVVCMLLIYAPPSGNSLVTFFSILGAGICMGFGAIGPGVGQGIASAQACENVGINPYNINSIMRTMLIGQAVTTSTATYALVVALLLMFVVGG